MVTAGHDAEARIELLSTSSGGLQGPLPSGTRSLILQFESPGARDVPVHLWFWHDLARIYATPGITFDIWYGRVVGAGVVEELVAPFDDGAP